MRTCTAGAAVLALSLVGPAGVFAQTTLSEQTPPAAQSQPPENPSPDELGISLERVKFALAQAQPTPLKISPDPPTFRVQIVEAQRPWLLDFRSALKIPWAPVPSGGRDYYEFMKMVTPPQAQPYGAFNSGELAQVVATSLVSALMMYGLKQAGGYIQDRYREGLEERVREEVRREFEQYLREHPEAPRPTWWMGVIR